MFREYPYLNLQDLNLDYILRKIREMQKELNNFVVTNAIKYADPIDWNITTQYEKNTVVIDANSGIAYLSVQPVPSGVAITNTNYWTVIFDLSMFIDKAAKNLTDHVESDETSTATFTSAAGDWLIWYDKLYVVLSNINIGDAYVENTNIRRFTIEDFGGHLDDLNTTDKSNIVNAINELVQAIIDESVRVGDLTDLETTDKSSVVNAINENVDNIEFVDDRADLLQGTVNFAKPSYYTYGANSDMQSLGYNSTTNQYVGIEGLYPSADFVVFDNDMNFVSTTPANIVSSDIEDLHYDAVRDCYWAGINNPIGVVQISSTFTVLNIYPVTTTGVDAVGYHDNIIAVMTNDNRILLYDVSNGFDLVKKFSFVPLYTGGIQGCCYDGVNIYATTYNLHGNKYMNMLYIINTDTEEYRIQFVDYWWNNAEMQGCFIANDKLNIYGISVPYSGRCWWLSKCDFHAAGTFPILPSEGSGTPLHLYVNEDYTTIGDGDDESTALNDLKLAMFRLNYGTPNILSCKRLHKGTGETLTFFGMNIKMEGDSTVPGYSFVFSNCDVTIDTIPLHTYVQFVNHTKAKLKSCGIDNIFVEDSELELQNCYFNATAGPSTDTLYVDRGVVKMTGTDAASYTSGIINAGIVIGETPSYNLNLTLNDGSQHFV